MGDFSGTITVRTGSQALFDHLCASSNLPQHFSRLTSAVPGDGEGVHATAAGTPAGSSVRGNAWFRAVDPEAQRIEWGSEEPGDYHGHLVVSSTGHGSSSVEVHVHTARVDDGDHVAQNVITETLDEIRRLVESQGAAS